MDDKFLHDARRIPRPEFAAALREKLRRQEAPAPAGRGDRRGRRPGPAWVALPAALAVAALFTIPSVRVSAQAFLDLFRVRNFAAVEFDPSRLDRLRELHTETGRDPALLVFDRTDVVRDPGKPVAYPTPEAAAAAAGIALRLPAEVPEGLRVDSVLVHGEGEARLTVDAGKLREVLASLGITDASVPENLDGAQVSLHLWPAVGIIYRSERHRVAVLQARSPEVALPQGLDLARLGELGLRVVGLSAAEARRFAQSIDWHSTLLVPVPANATSFREVSVRGNKALLITTTGEPGGSARRLRRGSILLWSEGEMVYALTGSIDHVSLVQMADSMR